jgi:hypothetical protein
MESTANHTDIKAGSPKGPRRLGAYSRVLECGAIGDTLDGRSREGRFLRAIESELTRGRRANLRVEERVLLRRVAKIAVPASSIPRGYTRAGLEPAAWTPCVSAMPAAHCIDQGRHPNSSSK